MTEQQQQQQLIDQKSLEQLLTLIASTSRAAKDLLINTLWFWGKDFKDPNTFAGFHDWSTPKNVAQELVGVRSSIRRILYGSWNALYSEIGYLSSVFHYTIGTKNIVLDEYVGRTLQPETTLFGDARIIPGVEIRLTDARPGQLGCATFSGFYGQFLKVDFDYRCGGGGGFNGDGMSFDIGPAKESTWYMMDGGKPNGAGLPKQPSVYFSLAEYTNNIHFGIPGDVVPSAPVTGIRFDDNTWRRVSLSITHAFSTTSATLQIQGTGVSITRDFPAGQQYWDQSTPLYMHIFGRCGGAVNEHAIKNIVVTAPHKTPGRDAD